MFISFDAKKAFEKIKHLFMIKKKILEISEIQETFLSTIKAIFSKSIVNIILNNEKLMAVPLKSGTQHDYLLSPYHFSIVFKALTRAIR